MAGSCAWHSLRSQLCPLPRISPGFSFPGSGVSGGLGEERGGWRLALQRGSGHQAGHGHSVCCPHPGGRLQLFPSCAGCSLSTPMGSEVTSSIPSSVKPAFSSLTYFPALQCWNNASLCSLFRPILCWSWCRSPGLCQAFCLESLTSVDGKRKGEKKSFHKTELSCPTDAQILAE